MTYTNPRCIARLSSFGMVALTTGIEIFTPQDIPMTGQIIWMLDGNNPP